jgi:butyryl-CoA dehydrogenase
MDYFLTEEQTFIRDTARQIAEEKVVPVRAELDEKEEFPRDIMNVIAQSDLFGVYIPEEYEGLGMGSFELCLAVEELSRACLGVSTSFAANALGTYPFLLFGSEEQKKKYLPDIAAGKKLVAFGLTEANAGSDAGGIQTTARPDGDHYVLNGTKQWITNAGEARTRPRAPAGRRPSSWRRAPRGSPSERRKRRWASAAPPRPNWSLRTAAFRRKTSSPGRAWASS